MAGCISKPFRERSSGLAPLLGLLLIAGAMGSPADNASDPAAAGKVTAVRFWSLGDTTRIAIEVSSEFRFKYERLSNPDRLYFDLFGTTPEMASRAMQIIHVDDAIIKQIRVAQTQPGVTRVVVDLQQPASLTTSQLSNPERLMIEVKSMEGRSSETKSSKAVSGESKPGDVKTSESKTGGGKTDGINPGGDKQNSSASAPEKTPAASARTSPPASSPFPPSPTASSLPTPRDVVATTASRSGEPLAKTTAKRSLTAVPNSAAEKMAATGPVGETPKPESKLSESAKSSDGTLAKASPSGVSRATNFEDRAEGAPANPVLNPFANTTSLASNVNPTLPPEPLGAEPPSSRSHVEEVLPAKRGTTDDRSLTRALGLKLGRVVIDPGHGGHDVGTHGPSGYFEKDLVLDVSRRLAALIQERMASDVILTRTDDTYVGLEERTHIANERKADLFLSIHANSSSYRAAAGVETYILNFTTSKAAMDLAARENASSELAIHDLQDLLQKIALRDKIDESHELAARLQTSLSVLSTHSNDAAKNRGVKKAPFVVLIGANMPSVLAEIGFLSNASDEALLRKPEHRQKIAEALYKGISSYADTLSRVIARQN